jgi:hypothetical protein
MIKKMLGIEEVKNDISEINKKICELAENLRKAWDWFKLMEKRIEKNEKEINETKAMVLEIFNRINQISISLGAEEKTKPKIKIESMIIEILKQNKSFDESSAIPTSKIQQFLPFKITERGLRKKLEKMQIEGVISGLKMKKTKYWFLKKLE